MSTPAMNLALDLHTPPPTNSSPSYDEEVRAAHSLSTSKARLVRRSITSDNWPEKVLAFRRLFNLPVPNQLTQLTPAQRRLQRNMLTEEFSELLEADGDGNITETVDGLLDLIYIATGWLVELGLTPAQINELMSEIHAANLTKVQDDGTPLINAMIDGKLINNQQPIGKVLKTNNYLGPQIAQLLLGYRPETANKE